MHASPYRLRAVELRRQAFIAEAARDRLVSETRRDRVPLVASVCSIRPSVAIVSNALIARLRCMFDPRRAAPASARL